MTRDEEIDHVAKMLCAGRAIDPDLTDRDRYKVWLEDNLKDHDIMRGWEEYRLEAWAIISMRDQVFSEDIQTESGEQYAYSPYPSPVSFEGGVWGNPECDVFPDSQKQEAKK